MGNSDGVTVAIPMRKDTGDVDQVTIFNTGGTECQFKTLKLVAVITDTFAAKNSLGGKVVRIQGSFPRRFDEVVPPKGDESIEF